MYVGKLVFNQIMQHMPLRSLHTCIKRYQGNYKVKNFSCFDQFLSMAFAQLTYRESLRDIEVCLRAQQSKLYHMGIRSKISRNTLAHANNTRDWRIYADFAQTLINIARTLYANDSFGIDLNETVYALDATTIDLCLATFPWASFRKAKGAIKLHTLLDLRGAIPSFISITKGSVHEVKLLDQLLIEAGATYLLDRGYIDFARLYHITDEQAFFVIRAKKNLKCRRLYSHPIDKNKGLRCDQTIKLTNYYAAKDYPDKLRRIRYFDQNTNKHLCFLSNNFKLPALTIAQLYKCRWQIELFFKWIKQHLRIKKFYGTSENAVKTQIWIAVSVYVLIAILKKRLNLKQNLYTILQVLSLTAFEKMPIQQLFADDDCTLLKNNSHNQLNLFN